MNKDTSYCSVVSLRPIFTIFSNLYGGMVEMNFSFSESAGKWFVLQLHIDMHEDARRIERGPASQIM